MSVGLARVTINAPQRRVDVALPEHVPLAELLPEMLGHAGEGLADDGERHGGWVLRRTDGALLATAQGLYAQGVRDGEVLHLVPARDQWPELEYDDVVEAIAAGARRRGGGWTPGATRDAALVGGAVPLALGLFAVLAAGPGSPGAAWVGLGSCLLLTFAAVIASRAFGDGRAGAVLGAAAMPYAFAGGALIVASAPGDRAGVLAPLPWLGGPELLAGSVALLLAATLSGIGVAATSRVFAAGATVGLLGALTALADPLTTAIGAAAALIAVLVCGIGGLPLLAIRFGKLPAPPIAMPSSTMTATPTIATPTIATSMTATSMTGTPMSASQPITGDARASVSGNGPAVFAAVARTEELLTGMLTGHALLCAGAFVVLAASGTWPARILTAVSAAALLLRSRLFVTVRQRVPLLAGGLFGMAALGVSLVGGGGPVAPVAVCGGGVAVALITVSAGATYAGRSPSPYLGRAADLLDALVVLSVIPVACAVLGLYAAVGDVTIK